MVDSVAAMKLRFCVNVLGCFQIWLRFHNATQYSVLYQSRSGRHSWPGTYMYLSSFMHTQHARASRGSVRTLSAPTLSVSLSLSSCICAPCKTSVWESTSRSTERAVGRGRRRSPSPQYRVPIQVVRRERSGVITTRGGRLLTSASEQKQQDVKMGIELGSGLGSHRQRRGGNHSPTPEMRGGSLRTSIGGSE